MYNVGTEKQLFIDHRFIESCEGVSLVMNPPQQPSTPVLVPDRPWEEKGICMYNTVIRESDGIFRMWYGAAMKTGLPQEGAIRLCYAESNDGLNWVKPSLGLIEFQGSKDNNIVAPLDEKQSMQGACVFRDQRAPAAERYKLMTKFRPTDAEVESGVKAGLWSMHSPDGIHWQCYPNQPNPAEQACDTQNMFWWDAAIGKYVCYTRAWQTQQAAEAAEFDQAKSVRFRAVARMTSDNFRDWSESDMVFRSDPRDLQITIPEDDQSPEHNVDFYNSAAFKYPYAQDVYLMMPSVYYHWTEDMQPATFDIQLLTSRNGINWQRQGDRAPFLRPGLAGSCSAGMIMVNPWMIPLKNGELCLYYTGVRRSHSNSSEATSDSGIFQAILRQDGFVSVDAGFESGELITPPLHFAGNRLELNCDGSAGGWLRVEILDSDGKALEGYAFDDADTITGNHIAQTVTWNSKKSLGDLKGRPVRLRFVMRYMKLYAFQFQAAST